MFSEKDLQYNFCILQKLHSQKKILWLLVPTCSKVFPSVNEGPIVPCHRFMNCRRVWISFGKGTEEPLRCLDLVTMASVSCICIISWGEREKVMHSTNKFQMEFSFDNFVSTWAQRPRCPRASSSRTMLSSKCSSSIPRTWSRLELVTVDRGGGVLCPRPLASQRLDSAPLQVSQTELPLLCRPSCRTDPRRTVPRTGFWQFQRISTIPTRCEAMTEDMVSQPPLLAPEKIVFPSKTWLFLCF